MKLVRCILTLVTLLGLGACKKNTNDNTSVSLSASNPEAAMKELSTGTDFCLPSENSEASSCEKVLSNFMNSPQFKGKEMLVSCGDQTVGFVYDAKMGGGGTLDRALADKLQRLMNNPNTNKNRLPNSCRFGFRPAD